MNAHADKTQENENQSAANSVSKKQSGSESAFRFVDNRPEAIAQTKLQEMANNSLQTKQAAQLQANANHHGKSPLTMVVQREVIAKTLVILEGGYPCFAMDGKKYHIDETEPKHVTCDSDGRTHYYFEGSGQDIVGNVGPGKKKKGKEQNKFKFESLPDSVQTFIKKHYDAIVTVKAVGQIDV